MRSHLSVRWLTCVFILLTFIFSMTAAHAARVAGVKGKKILISLEGEPAKRGDIYYLLDRNGKKRALIKIMKVKGNKALALLGKGRARKGMSLQARGGGSSRPSGPGRQAGHSGGKKSAGDSMINLDGALWGFMVSFDMDSMDVDLNANTSSAETVSLSGSSLSYKGMFDYNLFDKVWFRGFAGMDTFSADGPTKCSGKACAVEINYLTVDFWGRYIFSEGSFRPWLGGGFSLLYPMSNTATALDSSSITTTTVTSFGGGFDYFMSDTLYFPLQIEYGFFPTSEEVGASLLSIRTGVGFSF